MSKDTPSNIIEILHQIKVLESLRYIHFNTKSKLWKAIYEHISEEKICVLIDREAAILCDVLTDSSNEYDFEEGDEFDENTKFQYYIKFIDAAPYNKSITHIDDETLTEEKLSEMFILTLEVTYISDNEEFEDFTFPYTKEYSLLIPVDLELNFTKTKFKNWINSIRCAIDDTIMRNEMEELKRLVTKYEKELRG